MVDDAGESPYMAVVRAKLRQARSLYLLTYDKRFYVSVFDARSVMQADAILAFDAATGAWIAACLIDESEHWSNATEWLVRQCRRVLEACARRVAELEGKK